jgi:hypothetical protein
MSRNDDCQLFVRVGVREGACGVRVDVVVRECVSVVCQRKEGI